MIRDFSCSVGNAQKKYFGERMKRERKESKIELHRISCTWITVDCNGKRKKIWTIKLADSSSNIPFKLFFHNFLVLWNVKFSFVGINPLMLGNTVKCKKCTLRWI